MRVVAIINQKGGAAKSTTTMNLAAALSAAGLKVLVVDIDPQQTATDWARRAESLGAPLSFEVVPETDPAVLGRVREAEFDIVIVDTPGNLENMKTLQAVMEHADFAVMPTEPAFVAMKPLLNTYNSAVAPHGIDYVVVVTRADSRALGDVEDAQQMLAEAGLKVARSFIRTYKDHERAPGQGTVVGTYERTRSTDKAEKDYADLALELCAAWASKTSTAVTRG
jgi:chromosome partitioning protein